MPVTELGSHKGFLFDLDGVVYRGSKPIEPAIRFIQAIRTWPHMFLTNNSSISPLAVVGRLRSLGLKHVTRDCVLTSAQATALWLGRGTRRFSYFAIGGTGIQRALESAGTANPEAPDYVVVGEGRGLNYATLTRAINILDHGQARLIGTNEDASLDDTVNGRRRILPGGGALITPFAVAAAVQPLFIGKPNRIMYLTALRRLRLRPKDCCMVGDRPDTDILGAAQVGLRTVLVRTGRFGPRKPLREEWPRANFDVGSLADITPADVFSGWDSPYIHALEVRDGEPRLGRLFEHGHAEEAYVPQATVFVALMDRSGRIYLQHRSKAKRSYPDRKTISASGHVDPGETFEEAAVREMGEELGIHIRQADLQRVGCFTGERHCGPVFLVRSRGVPKPNPTEVDPEQSGFVSPGELARLLRDPTRFSPAGRRALLVVLETLGRRQAGVDRRVASSRSGRPARMGTRRPGVLIGIDFDGTLADTGAAKQEWALQHCGLAVVRGHCCRSGMLSEGMAPGDYSRMLRVACDREHTLRAEPCYGAADAVRELSRYATLCLVTDRGVFGGWLKWCWQWLEKQGLSGFFRRNALSTEHSARGRRGPTKGELCSRQGIDLLVDDDPASLVGLGRTVGIMYDREGDMAIPRHGKVLKARTWEEVLRLCRMRLRLR